MTKPGWLGAQGSSGAQTVLWRGWFALRRRCELDGAMAATSGNRGEKVKNDDGEGLIARLRSARKPCRSLPRASAKLKTATRAPGTKKKAAGGEVASVATVHQNYQIATRFKTQITPKFM